MQSDIVKESELPGQNKYCFCTGGTYYFNTDKNWMDFLVFLLMRLWYGKIIGYSSSMRLQLIVSVVHSKNEVYIGKLCSVPHKM